MQNRTIILVINLNSHGELVRRFVIPTPFNEWSKFIVAHRNRKYYFPPEQLPDQERVTFVFNWDYGTIEDWAMRQIERLDARYGIHLLEELPSGAEISFALVQDQIIVDPPEIRVGKTESVSEHHESKPDESIELRSESYDTGSAKRDKRIYAKSRAIIYLAPSAFEKAKAHAATSKNREVGGVLVGTYEKPERAGDVSKVYVHDAITAKHTVNRNASVTFTADSWSTAIDEIESKYGEEKVMIGWYHTHPGFGIFLSGYDLFIHENYFTEPWQVALVIDPRAKTDGFFTWHTNGEVVRYDDPVLTLETRKSAQSAEKSKASSQAEGSDESTMKQEGASVAESMPTLAAEPTITSANKAPMKSVPPIPQANLELSEKEKMEPPEPNTGD